MATYKKPCARCGAFVDGDARFCPSCGGQNPFGPLCPSCLRPVELGQPVCAGCGRPLYVTCPRCGGRTFALEMCIQCGVSLTAACPNPRCGALQFFENRKCTACGKKIQMR